MAKEHGLRLLRRAVDERSPLLADLAADVLVPPLSTLVLATVTGLAASVALSVVTLRPNVGLVLFGASGVFLAAYVVRGWQVSGTGMSGLASLVRAPAYMAWKATLRLRKRVEGTREWVRTTREARPTSA
jgi:hypothetical protein